MRNVIKYGLVLAVLAAGVYGANHFRIVGEPLVSTPNHYEFDPYSLPSQSTTGEAAETPSQPPLAVLVDTDRQQDAEPAGDRPPAVRAVPGIARQEASPPDDPQDPETTLPDLAREPGNRFSVPEDHETQAGDPETEDMPDQRPSDEKDAREEPPQEDGEKTGKTEESDPREDEEPEPDGSDPQESQRDESEQDESEQDESEQDESEQDEPEQDEPEQDESEQDEPEQDEPEQDKPEQDEREPKLPAEETSEHETAPEQEPTSGASDPTLLAEQAAGPARDAPPDSDQTTDTSANDQDLATVSESEETGPMRLGPRDLPVRHVIGEGDTLPKLAERYFGDRDRYREIFEANREVLHDPRLLPIGIELTITSAAESNAAKPDQASQEAETPAATPPEKASDDVPPKLQPIPPESLPRPGEAVSTPQ